MAGCLPKYLHSSFLPAGRHGVIRHSSLAGLIDGEINSLGLFNHGAPRIKATPPWYAYVKIAEGCDHHCSYCLIPSIRGRFRHRVMADILEEVAQLVKRGVKEVIYIAEDT